MPKIRKSLWQPKTCLQLSLLTNIALTWFKFFAGILGLSQAMIADALHSCSDILTTGIAYIGIHIAARPADKDHPYGHGNAETIAASLVSLVILGMGVYAATSAILAIVHQQFKAPLNIALIAACVSILIKEGLFRYTIKVGRLNNNPAVIAEAWHHRSDAFSSVAALIGIGGAKIAFLCLDPLAGLVVAGFIMAVAARLIRFNIGIIMDESPKDSLINNIKAVVQASEGVKRIDSLKVHRRGSKFTIDLEIAVDGNITVEAGHRIAANVRAKLLKQVRNVGEVMVHVNPYG